MDLTQFDYQLPPSAIAQEPATPRDGSRLLVLDRARARWADRRFADLPELLRPDDCLVLNESRVIPARLLGTRARAVATLGHVRLAYERAVDATHIGGKGLALAALVLGAVHFGAAGVFLGGTLAVKPRVIIVDHFAKPPTEYRYDQVIGITLTTNRSAKRGDTHSYHVTFKDGTTYHSDSAGWPRWKAVNAKFRPVIDLIAARSRVPVPVVIGCTSRRERTSDERPRSPVRRVLPRERPLDHPRDRRRAVRRPLPRA